MRPGEAGATWSRWLLGLLLAGAATGCAASRAHVEKNLRADRAAAARSDGVSEAYLVGCPDVIEIKVPHRVELSGQHVVQADGRIDLGDYGRLRVEGQPPMEIAREVAAECGAEPEQVQVRVAEFRSQYVVLFGQVVGWQRTVPYQGQETVLELLQRVGGITKGAEPDDVYVVRSHVADNQRPEVFHVNLRDIVVKRDEKTNVRVLPFDQVYVGATRQARVERMIPPWARPIYQAIWNTRPRTREADSAAQPVRSRWIAGPRLGTAREETATEE
jgi:protein involved in polysaccharide export with SLBB domain